MSLDIWATLKIVQSGHTAQYKTSKYLPTYLSHLFKLQARGTVFGHRPTYTDYVYFG